MRKAFTIFVIVAIALGVLSVWLLRSPGGQARIQKWLLSHLPASIRVEGISGALPFRGQVRLVELRDDAGVWCTAENISWSLQRRPLLRKEFVLNEITAKTVTVLRWPEFGPDEGEASSGASPTVRIQRAQVGALHLPVEVVGERISLSAQGDFLWAGSTWSGAGSATSTWLGEEIQVDGSAQANATQLTFTITRAVGQGFRVQGAGEWGPSRTIQLTGSFRDAPILTRLTGIENVGRGSATADMKWDDALATTFTFAVDDAAEYGIALDHAEGEGSFRDGDLDVQIANARGSWRDGAWRILRPVRVRYDAQGLHWESASLQWTDFTIETAGILSETAVEGHVLLLPVELADSPLSNRFSAGRAHLGLAVSGLRADPVWRYDLIGDDVRPNMGSGFQLNPAQFHSSGVLSSGVLRAEALLAGLTKEPATAHVELPLRMPLDGSAMGPDPEGTIAGKLQFALDLKEAGRYADLRGAELLGKLAADVEVGGVWSRPAVRGKIELSDARAEYPESGTVLNNIRILLEGDQDRLVIREASADDGEGGGISLDGAFLFSLADGFPLRAQLTLSRATLFRREGSRARFDGRVAVGGQLSALSVTGRVNVVDTEIQLRPSQPRIPQLPIASAAVATNVTEARASALDNVSLDVEVRGRDMRVNGRGLDSSWRADLRVTGRASAPRLTGPISVDRGYFLFLGRRFVLDRAVLALDGRWPPNPMLDMTASSRAGDMQAWLYAAGSVDELTLRLESDPAYPPDEILSRLLFGRSTDRISVFQAVSLAHGLSLLRGHGRTVDVLERGQSLLRVDQLELVQSEGSEGISAISVGKYVGRNVYVEGEKSLGSAADVITVEVELTPSLILSTESSPRIREGIGLKWRHDY